MGGDGEGLAGVTHHLVDLGWASTGEKAEVKGGRNQGDQEEQRQEEHGHPIPVLCRDAERGWAPQLLPPGPRVSPSVPWTLHGPGASRRDGNREGSASAPLSGPQGSPRDVSLPALRRCP